MIKVPSDLLQKRNIILSLAIFFVCVFCIYGIGWGRVETWHPDQWAYDDFLVNGKISLVPKSFFKPPLYTYLVFFLVTLPLMAFHRLMRFFFISSPDTILGKLASAYYPYHREIYIIATRMLTVFMVILSLLLIHRIMKRLFGVFAANIAVMLYATSAGIIAYSHFLTPDIPVVFFLLVSFYFAQNIMLRGKWGDYLWSGFFAGLATAVKYNGLGVAIAIVIAHGIRENIFHDWKKGIISYFHPKFITGSLMILVGFVTGNPYSLLRPKWFARDFLWMYVIGPTHGVGHEGNSFIPFIMGIPEIVGLPCTIFIAGALIWCVCRLIKRHYTMYEYGIVLILSVVVLYFLKMGSFAMTQTRYALPIVPFLCMLAGFFIKEIYEKKRWIKYLLVSVIGYNCVCSAYVGQRFLSDPRMAVKLWARDNVYPHAHIYISPYAPSFDRLGVDGVDQVVMPWVGGSDIKYEKLFEDDERVSKISTRMGNIERRNTLWYNPITLKQLHPDFVVMDSLYFKRFVDHPKEEYGYANEFFQGLLHEEYNYEIIFDRTTPPVPEWVYPKEIDFLDNRLVILKRARNEETVGDGYSSEELRRSF